MNRRYMKHRRKVVTYWGRRPPWVSTEERKVPGMKWKLLEGVKNNSLVV